MDKRSQSFAAATTLYLPSPSISHLCLSLHSFISHVTFPWSRKITPPWAPDSHPPSFPYSGQGRGARLWWALLSSHFHQLNNPPCRWVFYGCPFWAMCHISGHSIDHYSHVHAGNGRSESLMEGNQTNKNNVCSSQLLGCPTLAYPHSFMLRCGSPSSACPLNASAL